MYKFESNVGYSLIYRIEHEMSNDWTEKTIQTNSNGYTQVKKF